MPSDSKLAVALGPHKNKSDMILFQSDLLTPSMSDCTYDNGTWYDDHEQDWVYDITDDGSRRQKLFTARRALETTEENDFIFQVDREVEIGYYFERSGFLFDLKDGFPNSDTLLLLSDGQTCKGWDSLL